MLGLLHKDHLVPSATYALICGWQSLLGYPRISLDSLCASSSSAANNNNNNKLANVQDSAASSGGCSAKQLEWEAWSRSIPPPLTDVHLIPPSGTNYHRRHYRHVVVVSGAYTGFVEPRIGVTAWLQERPHAHIDSIGIIINCAIVYQ